VLIDNGRTKDYSLLRLYSADSIMTKKNAVTKFQRAAYHEAGHAVASYLVKRRLSYVTIEPNPDKHTPWVIVNIGT
jgi:hypothetical protein